MNFDLQHHTQQVLRQIKEAIDNFNKDCANIADYPDKVTIRFEGVEFVVPWKDVPIVEEG